MKIKELRESFGLTQKALGEKLGIDGHNVGDWERSKCEPSTDMLIKLADLFNCSIDYLVGREDDFGNVNIGGENVKLTKDEQTLLDCFNKMGPFERESILIQIKALSNK